MKFTFQRFDGSVPKWIFQAYIWKFHILIGKVR